MMYSASSLKRPLGNASLGHEDVGTSFLFVCADFEEYSPISAVVNGL